jgi:tetratricopeptide (TPR) repeat protein
VLSLAALAGAAVLLPAGWKGSRVYQALRPAQFGKLTQATAETHIDALSEAIGIWPMSDFYQNRAMIHQQIAASHDKGPAFKQAAELAIKDYLQAERLHPFEPSNSINTGNLQSMLGLDEEAEASFARGIRLQGGMEPGFRGHFSLARHYLRKGAGIYDSQNPAAALDTLQRAAEEIEMACKEMHWILPEFYEPRMTIHTYLGSAREAVGDYTGALACYDLLSSLHHGKRANYLAAVLIGKMSVDAWKQRKPEKALGGFIEARRRLLLSSDQRPEGVTFDDRNRYLNYLDQMIAFLKSARVEPAEWKPGK